jgi:hypothetical protein
MKAYKSPAKAINGKKIKDACRAFIKQIKTFLLTGLAFQKLIQKSKNLVADSC